MKANTAEQFDAMVSRFEPGQLFALNGITMRFVNIYKSRAHAKRVAAQRNVHPFQLRPGRYLVMHPSTEETP